MPYRPRKRKTTKKGTAKSTKPKASTANVDHLIAYLKQKVGDKWEVKPEHRFHEIRRWRFDAAVPELMLAVEYEGLGRKSRHTSYNGFIADVEKYSTAAAMGWWVLRFCHTHVSSGECFAIIDQALERLTGEKNGGLRDQAD
jgi:hypothetical protein